MRDDGLQYSCSFGPAGGDSVLDYYGPRWRKVSALLKGLTTGARAADPKVRRAVGTAGWGHISAFERMKADGIEWDISIWHMYGNDAVGRSASCSSTSVQYRSRSSTTHREARRAARSSRRPDEDHRAPACAGAEVRSRSGARGPELLDETYWSPSYEAYMGLVELSKVDGQWQIRSAKAGLRCRTAPDCAKPGEAVAWSLEVRRTCELRPDSASRKLAEANVIIDYAYCLQVLGREPDGAGRLGYATRLAGRMTARAVPARAYQQRRSCGAV